MMLEESCDAIKIISRAGIMRCRGERQNDEVRGVGAHRRDRNEMGRREGI